MSLDIELTGRFIPLDSVSAEHIPQLAERARIERHPAGEKLFAAGDEDDYSCFLISGIVELAARDGRKQHIEADTDQARYALANLKPRQYDGLTVTESNILWIETVAIDTLLTWDHLSGQRDQGVTVTEYDEGNVWILDMLRSQAFLKLPTANIERLVEAMERVDVKATDIIIHQNMSADYYYLIREGRCDVARRNKQGALSKIAELGPGDCFGEEALVSDRPRNASVTMLTDGILMRLSKENFRELLQEPLIKTVTPEQAKAMVAQGATLLDIRTKAEYEHDDHIIGSINIPLFLLRLRFENLNQEGRYIVYCDSGARSAAAVFLMTQRNYEAYLLDGGIAGLLE